MIRATMTEDMIEWEKKSGLFGKQLMNKLHSVYYAEIDGSVKLRCSKDVIAKVNFEGGATAQYVASTVMSELDRQNARDRNLKLKVEGTTALERFQKISKRITSGKLHLDVRQSLLDNNLLGEVRRKCSESAQTKSVKKQKNDLQYMKTCHQADEAIKKYGKDNIDKWPNKAAIKLFLKPLKQPSDSKMPDDREGLVERYKAWKHREREDISKEQSVLDEFEKWLKDEKDRGK